VFLSRLLEWLAPPLDPGGYDHDAEMRRRRKAARPKPCRWGDPEHNIQRAAVGDRLVTVHRQINGYEGAAYDRHEALVEVLLDLRNYAAREGIPFDRAADEALNLHEGYAGTAKVLRGERH
jgi:hypothetical protein